MYDIKPAVTANEPEYQEWREINFNGSTAMLRTDVSLTAEMVNEHFPPFNVIETDHKVCDRLKIRTFSGDQKGSKIRPVGSLHFNPAFN
uniref:Uncharacterized protein n=1 Tax=Parascaris equorum TaxID=6256 RepID=A0A914RTS4_PAREQ